MLPLTRANTRMHPPRCLASRRDGHVHVLVHRQGIGNAAEGSKRLWFLADRFASSLEAAEREQERARLVCCTSETSRDRDEEGEQTRAEGEGRGDPCAMTLDRKDQPTSEEDGGGKGRAHGQEGEPIREQGDGGGDRDAMALGGKDKPTEEDGGGKGRAHEYVDANSALDSQGNQPTEEEEMGNRALGVEEAGEEGSEATPAHPLAGTLGRCVCVCVCGYVCV